MTDAYIRARCSAYPGRLCVSLSLAFLMLPSHVQVLSRRPVDLSHSVPQKGRFCERRRIQILLKIKMFLLFGRSGLRMGAILELQSLVDQRCLWNPQLDAGASVSAALTNGARAVLLHSLPCVLASVSGKCRSCAVGQAGGPCCPFHTCGAVQVAGRQCYWSLALLCIAWQ